MLNPPLDSFHPKSRAEWRKWLEENHTRTEGVWLVMYKKGTGKPRVDYAEAVEEALCFGWIDSKGNKLDDERSMLWMAPRKSKTGWSKLNKERIKKLIKAKLMTPPGLAKINAAKKDGTWNALDAIEALEIPPDLAKAFAENKIAKEYFDAFPRSAKRAILEWIASAKRTETRANRIEETVTKAEQNIRANQWRQGLE
ncbi:MAG TPA: YdeI/OmpD-associated family protein [Anaerolineales bacterium]|nr:YdeI/OmpD-associated family protein [Anaerolineales bacterium]